MAGTRTVDNTFFVSSIPWVDRGGNYNNGSGTGVFNFNRNNGWGNTANSFRSVLSLLNYGLKIVKKCFFKTQNRGLWLNIYIIIH